MLTWEAFLARLLCTAIHALANLMQTSRKVGMKFPEPEAARPSKSAFRDHYQELQALGAGCFGLSTQTTEYQQEAVRRLHLPFNLLSDVELAFTKCLQLPTFEVESMTLIKRLTLIVENGRIEKVFYPVFPPEHNAEEVIDWLSHHPQTNDS